MRNKQCFVHVCEQGGREKKDRKKLVGGKTNQMKGAVGKTGPKRRGVQDTAVPEALRWL